MMKNRPSTNTIFFFRDFFGISTIIIIIMKSSIFAGDKLCVYVCVRVLVFNLYF